MVLETLEDLAKRAKNEEIIKMYIKSLMILLQNQILVLRS